MPPPYARPRRVAPSGAPSMPVTTRRPASPSPRAVWWATFVLLSLAGVAWAVATPLMSGADESDHAIRAAAVVRGQPVGGEAVPLGTADNVFITVDVPEAYADAREVSGCFIDFRDSPVPQVEGRAELPPCRPMEGGRDRAEVLTLQYRGQPSYYAVVGLPSLLDPGPGGVTGMRVLSGVVSAALLASALAAARSATGGLLVPVAVLTGITPVVLWLSGQVNSGGWEIAAALLVWTAGAAVARAPEVAGRDVTRLGVGVIALTVVRGLSPAFGIGALVVLALLAGRPRLQELARRRDVRLWGAAAALSWLLSVAWLAYVQLAYPLDPRPGTGVGHAAAQWTWYLRQTVGVFGVNDIVLPWVPVVAWLAVVAAVVGLGLARTGWWERGVIAVVALGAFAVNITAEGLSFPPIGYFWQGRYILPVLVGIPVLAAACAGDGRGRPLPRPPAVALAAVLVGVHVWGFAQVARHMASQGRALGFVDALTDPVWTPPLLPAWAWTLLYALVLAGVAALALGGPAPDRERGPAGPSPYRGGLGHDDDPDPDLVPAAPSGGPARAP